jgi:hypothetical protein
VISVNYRRKHGTESQRAMVAAKVANGTWGGDRGNQHTGGKPSIDDLPLGKAAKLFNVSPKSVERARVVRATDEAGEPRFPKLVSAERGANAPESGANAPEPTAHDAKAERAEEQPRKFRIDMLSRRRRDPRHAGGRRTGGREGR